jgi:hypothetical protein
MIAIESDTFNIDDVMALFRGVDTKFILAGTWNKIPWRVFLHEPSDTLQPASWILELGDHRYPLQQSTAWEMNPGTKTWEENKSSWRIRTADGRWVPSLRDLGADVTVD